MTAQKQVRKVFAHTLKCAGYVYGNVWLLMHFCIVVVVAVIAFVSRSLARECTQFVLFACGGTALIHAPHRLL